MSAAEHPRGFASDNFSGVHPEVLDAIAAANAGHAPAYGGDRWTAAAEACFRERFGSSAQPFIVFNGTGANVVALRAMARRTDAVICPAGAHMNVDECGAPEAIAGVKLLPVPAADGKLTPEQVAARIERVGDQHAVQPRVVSISNATELGTVYRPDEVWALAELAHDRGMYLHVDGARLANAAASLDASLAELSGEAGVDALSFGGTKNGLLGADAVVVFDDELAEGLEYLRKQSLQLASKMRFLAAQFEALLGGELWLRSARQANAMARRLADAVSALDGVGITQPVESNAVFATLPTESIGRLRDALPGELPFYVWNRETGECRWMCTWDTTPDDVDRFAEALRTALGGESG